MSGVTMVGDVAGTIAYMPPEQVRDFKDVRPPSDIYALGMTAYSLLTGAHALDINSAAGISEVIKAIFEKPIIPLVQRIPEIPKRVSEVIETAIEKQVELRWATASQMRAALLEAVER
jgi:serine/threonine-protein kinase